LKLISAFLALAFAFSSAAAAQEVTHHTSPDGHEFSFYHMPDADRLAISIAWKGGIANLPQGKENVAALAIDLMLNGGADGQDPADIRAEFEALDAGSHLYTDSDAIRGFLVTPAKDAEKAADIANRVLVKPNLDERWFKRSIRKTKQNVAEKEKHNAIQAWHTIRRLTMQGHPLEQVWSVQPAGNLDAITVEDLRKWHSESFSANDLVISAAGNGSPEEIGLGLDLTLKGLPREHKRSDLPPLEMAYNGKTILIHRPEEEKSFMAIVGPLPEGAHPDKLALQLGTGVLGSSEQSRLFKAVRGELRAAYGFFAQIHPFTRAQDMLALSGEVEASKLRETLAKVEETYNEMKSGGIGFLEYPFAKRIMMKRIRENYKKPSTLAFVMTEAHFEGKTLEEVINLEAKADDMGRGEVNTAIKKHFPEFSQMIKVIVTPDAEAIEADCVITDFRQADQCR